MAMTTRSKNLLLLALMVLPFILTFAYVRLFVDLDDMERNNKGNLIIPHVDFSDLKPRLPDGGAALQRPVARVGTKYSCNY